MLSSQLPTSHKGHDSQEGCSNLCGIVHTDEMLQEHPLLAWPLFIFLLTLAFYLYPEDYARIHMQYLFWLTVLSPFLYWLYFL
jgi:hypothetical protein